MQGNSYRLFLDKSSLTKLMHLLRVEIYRVYGVCRISSLRHSGCATNFYKLTVFSLFIYKYKFMQLYYKI